LILILSQGQCHDSVSVDQSGLEPTDIIIT